jgi:hypothetical protein
MSGHRRAAQNRRARRRADAPSPGFAFARLIAAVQASGFPVIVDGNVAYTYCPGCFAKGKRSLLEMRVRSAGVHMRELDGERAAQLLAELDLMTSENDGGTAA